MSSEGKNTNYTLNVPDVNIPDSEKTEDWHKQFVQSIVNRSLTNSYDLDYYSMSEAYNFYLGTQQDTSFEFMRTAEDGDSLPAQWINFNKIKVKIDLMLGELSAKGYEVNVSANNKDAKIRKMEAKENSRVDMRMGPLVGQLEQSNGMQLQKEGFVPKDESELDEYYNYNYKEKSEIVMHFMLKDILNKSMWDYQRVALFRDLLIAGRCFVKDEVVNGIPQTRRIDPRFMIFDTSCQDDFLSDSTFFGEIRYMNVGEVAAQYGLTKKELKDAYNAYKEYNSLTGSGMVDARNSSGSGSFNDFSSFGPSRLKLYKIENGELRILISSASWVDYKDLTYKKSEDKYGNEHIKKVALASKENPNVKRINIKIWREGTLIGGKFLVNWGEVKNQTRDVDNFSTTTSPYKGLIPNYINGVTVSKVDQLKGLQNLKDITMFNVQLAMSRAGAKGFVYDTSQVPDEWDIHNVIKYLKTTGIAFVDSRKDGLPSNFNQFTPIDMTLSKSVTQYIDISRMIDSEMDAISGVNEARQGLIGSANQAVGVTQSALFQSNLATETYFKFFSRFAGDIFTHLAGLGKIAWADKDKFAYIIGDSGIDFLSQDIDLDLDDYSVKITEIPTILDDVQSFQAMVQAALQAGQIDFIAAVKLMREKDVVQGVIRLERDMQVRQQAQKEQMAQEQQMQAQAAQQESNNRMKEMQAQEQFKTQGDIAVEEVKQKGKSQEQAIKGKFDIAGQKIDFAKALTTENIKARNAKRAASIGKNK